jgi:hypothetical protein
VKRPVAHCRLYGTANNGLDRYDEAEVEETTKAKLVVAVCD